MRKPRRQAHQSESEPVEEVELMKDTEEDRWIEEGVEQVFDELGDGLDGACSGHYREKP